MEKKLPVLLAVVLTLIASCKGPVEKYCSWMQEYIPLPDQLQYDGDYWESNVRKTLEVRQKMGWGIPEREFRHFVLPLRVNNETLDDFRTKYADTLCARVRGLSLGQAALEINHWCHEQATYQTSDGRTGGPESIMMRGTGRCGEESVLAVSALRAAGIPARQVYTPRWAHTDDNHAWVEVWVDGRWHFMGACEPEPVLDRAWFNSSVSRAMILHTKVFGDYDGPEDVIRKTPCYTEINVTRGYVPTRRTTVTILRDGKPVSGALVSFRIYNYAEFYQVASYLSDSEGRASLDTGMGDIFVFAAKDGRFGYAVASSEESIIELNHSFGDEFDDELDIVPPAETARALPVKDSDVYANTLRLASEDSVRLSRDHRNHAVERFRNNYPDRAGQVLGLLSEKDLADVGYDVLEDALLGCGSERIELEHLLPYRAEILSSGEMHGLSDTAAVKRWCEENISIVNDRNPQDLRIPPIAVWRSRKADSLGFKIFYVALCRTLGIEKAFDTVTGQVEQTAPQALLRPVSGRYFRDYTLTRISPDGEMSLLDYESGLPEVLSVDEGYYLLTTGRRLSDGSVLARLEFKLYKGGDNKDLTPVIRDASGRPSVLETMNPEALYVADGQKESFPLLSATGRGWFLLVITGGSDEPSIHARRQLEAASGLLNDWGRPVVILGKAGKVGKSGKHLPSGLNNTVVGTDVSVMDSFEGKHIVPMVAICDSFGRVVYLSEGYNTSLASDLENTIPLL